MPPSDRINPQAVPFCLPAIPLARVVVVVSSLLLVGCGGGAADGSGHGWIFLLTFCALVWFGYQAAKGTEGMTLGRFCGWMVWNFLVWHGMSWTVNGVGWLFHRAGDAKDWVAVHAKDEASKPQPATDQSSVVSEQSASESRLPVPREKLLTPKPSPVEATVNKPTGGEAMRMLQEAHAPLPNQGQELDFLEKRTSEIELALLSGLKKATAGTQPVEDLNHMVQELKLLSFSLKVPEDCSFWKSLATLREQLAKKRNEFEQKSIRATTGKSIYMDMLKEIGPMQIRADALVGRFQAIKSHAEALAQEATGWIELYRDTVSFKGDSAAREELAKLLHEKEKSIREDQLKSQ